MEQTEFIDQEEVANLVGEINKQIIRGMTIIHDLDIKTVVKIRKIIDPEIIEKGLRIVHEELLGFLPEKDQDFFKWPV